MRCGTIVVTAIFALAVQGCGDVRPAEQSPTTTSKPATTRPATRPAIDPPTEQGLRHMLEGAIERANAKAKINEDQIYFQSVAFNRHMSFIPTTLPQYGPPTIITKRWTDRYIMAQRFQYRYSLDHIVMRTKEPALVYIKITSWEWQSLWEDENPIPKTPAGHRPFKTSWRGFGLRSSGCVSKDLHAVHLREEMVTQLTHPAVPELLSRLKIATPLKKEVVYTQEGCFDPDYGWMVTCRVYQQSEPTSLQELKADRGYFVGAATRPWDGPDDK